MESGVALATRIMWPTLRENVSNTDHKARTKDAHVNDGEVHDRLELAEVAVRNDTACAREPIRVDN